MSIAYLNGSWQPLEETRVSVLDRGFMFGDGVYEVIPVYGRRPFAEDAHLERLSRSLQALHIARPMTDQVWRMLFREAIERGGMDEAILYIQVTRGVASSRSHVYQGSAPTVLISVTAKPDRTDIKPYRMVTKTDFRWLRGDIKTISLAANSLLKNEAMEQGYDDAILIRDGNVMEATSSNVFIVKNGVVSTPIANNYLLHGVTRAQIIALAEDHGIDLQERDIPEAELLAADEVWITSTGNEVWPVVQVNEQTIGDGESGAVYRTMFNLFQELKCRSG